MLRAFPAAYEVVPDGGDGPKIPDEADEDYDEQLAAACCAVLKSGDAKAATYSDQKKKAFFWYRYLFLGRSKPVTHISALARLSNEELAKGAPAVLTRLLGKMKDSILEKLPE